ARSLDDGLVVAGDEARVLAKPHDLQGHEILLEEGARPDAIGNPARTGDAAGLAERGAQRPGIRRRTMLGRDRPAARAKCLVGGELIVLVPAGYIGPAKLEILAAADLKRELELRIGQGARGLWADEMAGVPAARRQHDNGNQHLRSRGNPQNREGSLETPGFSERFPCQPASSSD